MWRRFLFVATEPSRPSRISCSRMKRSQIALQALAAEIAPIDDMRSTKNYRLRVSLNLLQDFLSQLTPSHFGRGLG